MKAKRKTKGMKMAFDLTHACHDQAHCLAPGLFRSLGRGERKKRKLDVSYQYGKNEEIRFVGFEPLGADDLRLLQGLIALGGPEGFLLTPNPTNETAINLRQDLKTKFDAATQDGLVIRTTMVRLLKEIGLTGGGDNMKALKESLLRISNVSVAVTKNTRQAAFHMLSYAFDEGCGQLVVALNPRIAEAILGERTYARIEMSEVRALKSDPARLIHQRLCGWIDPGKSGRVELDTLCEYVWPEEAKNFNTLKTRKQIARKALTELIDLKWSVEEYAKNKWKIERPKNTPA